jgi:hypothetical protein
MSDVMNPKSKDLVVRGEKLTIGEFKVRHFRVVAANMTLIMKVMNDSTATYKEYLSGFDGVSQIIQAVAAKPKTWVEDLSLSEGMEILETIVEVNKDSFLQRILPGVGRMADQFQGVKTETTTGGTPASSSSLPMDMDSKK